MITEGQLVDLAERYGARHKASLKTVSSRVFDDGKVLDRIREGRGSITMVRAARAWQWFADHWPDDVPWPVEIPKPQSILQSA